MGRIALGKIAIWQCVLAWARRQAGQRPQGSISDLCVWLLACFTDDVIGCRSPVYTNLEYAHSTSWHN